MNPEDTTAAEAALAAIHDQIAAENARHQNAMDPLKKAEREATDKLALHKLGFKAGSLIEITKRIGYGKTAREQTQMVRVTRITEVSGQFGIRFKGHVIRKSDGKQAEYRQDFWTDNIRVLEVEAPAEEAK